MIKKVRKYIYIQEDAEEASCSHEFSLDLSNIAITYRQCQQACGKKVYKEILIYSDDMLRTHFLCLFNLISKNYQQLHTFFNSIICPLFKGGDCSQMHQDSYRPVAPTSFLCKLMERLIIPHHQQTFLSHWVQLNIPTCTSWNSSGYELFGSTETCGWCWFCIQCKTHLANAHSTSWPFFRDKNLTQASHWHLWEFWNCHLALDGFMPPFSMTCDFGSDIALILANWHKRAVVHHIAQYLPLIYIWFMWRL